MIIIFYHIGKTAGSTITKLLSEYNSEKLSFDNLYDKTINKKLDFKLKYYVEQYGHHVNSFYKNISKIIELKSIHNDNLFIFTIFRQPIEQTLSLYNYFKKLNIPTCDKEKIADTLRFNYQSHYLYNTTTFWNDKENYLNEEDTNKLINYIDLYIDHVGITDNLYYTSKIFYEKFNIKLDFSRKYNVTERSLKLNDLNDDQIEIIKEKTKIDNFIYNKYKNLLESHFNVTLFGSCRLDIIYKNNNLNNLLNYCHSTKETIQLIKFLKCEQRFPYPYNIICFRTGIVARKPIEYKKKYNHIFNKSKICIIEICSLKKYEHNNFYCHRLSIYDKIGGYYTITPKNIKDTCKIKKQSYDEIEKDILEIKRLLHPKKILIVTHYNSKLNNNFLEDRNKLIGFVEDICKKNKIDFINPTKLLSNFEQNKVMSEDLSHYTELGIKEIKKFLDSKVSNINN